MIVKSIHGENRCAFTGSDSIWIVPFQVLRGVVMEIRSSPKLIITIVESSPLGVELIREHQIPCLTGV
ncbi:hypothetical protein WICPIJ_009438 [Wickerhamomyces pijperi]|uniref:Uncharacterized protein n=1 Tax=Wickerhamomyces pijperi TaxID=599730 RepID=A0A9P8TCX7_WICPI|nr:hypothetical protein WICPIJ_009438 [Wickerhamomyces pijperi]